MIIKTICLNCGEVVSIKPIKDELGIYGVCPVCGSSFDVDINKTEGEQNMINTIITLKETDPMYDALKEKINDMKDDNLIIVARSYKNRKDDVIEPISVKNGIYFYLGYMLDDALAFPTKVTPSQIYKAKANMVKRARLGSLSGMIENIMFGGDNINKPFDEYVYEKDGDPSIVVTLDNCMNGAGLLYCEEFLKEIQKIDEFYILPSSIHELILMPTSFGDKEELSDIVRTINGDVVSEEDFLSDDIFKISEWV